MTINSTLRSIFGKTLAIAFFAAVMTVASYAQTGTLYEGNSRFGIITLNGSVWVINNMNGGGEIKIYSCTQTSPTNCSFTQFQSSGRTAYSGNAWMNNTGGVVLYYRYDFTSGYQRNIGGQTNLQVR